MTDADKQLYTEITMRKIANLLNNVIEESIGENMGFVLIVFEFDKPTLSNYVSNASRENVIKGLRETANNLEKEKNVLKTHGTVQ